MTRSITCLQRNITLILTIGILFLAQLDKSNQGQHDEHGNRFFNLARHKFWFFRLIHPKDRHRANGHYYFLRKFMRYARETSQPIQSLVASCVGALTEW